MALTDYFKVNTPISWIHPPFSRMAVEVRPHLPEHVPYDSALRPIPRTNVDKVVRCGGGIYLEHQVFPTSVLESCTLKISLHINDPRNERSLDGLIAEKTNNERRAERVMPRGGAGEGDGLGTCFRRMETSEQETNKCFTPSAGSTASKQAIPRHRTPAVPSRLIKPARQRRGRFAPRQ